MQTYALITTQCNLSCPHCDIKDQDDHYNEKAFIDQLVNNPGVITLFGGEPTLYEDRLKTIINHPGIKDQKMSITTNLVHLTPNIIEMLKQIKSIGTSWNPNRFTDKEYQYWLDNLQVLKSEGFKVGVLITLDRDLISMNSSEVMDIFRSWDSDVISSIRFEQVVADYTSKEWFDQVDNWLCQLRELWDIKIINKLDQLVFNWNYDCSNVYTLYPDGTRWQGCPHIQYRYIPTECYSCPHSDNCNPCILQKNCSFPKKYYELIKSKYSNKGGKI